MSKERMAIDITNVDLVELVKKVYDMSNPVGMGFLHYQPEPLSDEDAKDIVNRNKEPYGSVLLDMDYVHGRCCKFTVWENDGKRTIPNVWFDHTDKQLAELLAHFNIKITDFGPHGCGCECDDCRFKRVTRN